MCAYDYLDQMWNQVVAEIDAVEAGDTVEQPLCMGNHLALAGQEDNQTNEIGIVRMLILQDESVRAVTNTASGSADRLTI